jgi:hypothetical protein
LIIDAPKNCEFDGCQKLDDLSVGEASSKIEIVEIVPAASASGDGSLLRILNSDRE